MNDVRTMILSLMLAGLLLFGCSSRSVEGRLPATDPDIRGIITRADRSSDAFHILVEADPSDSTLSGATAKSRVRVSESAELWRRNGDELEKIESSALKEGSTVSVWFDGPVLQSYPSQAGAKVVLLEEEAEG